LAGASRTAQVPAQCPDSNQRKENVAHGP
jgi:hypothetical protein